MTATADTGTGANGSFKETSLERRCENKDCHINKLVSMVPKRKTAQFVTSPIIVEKPMLVNGYTTIFQVDGTAAKISDLKKPGNGEPRTIYRIMPKVHAHIINYVVVDNEGESLRKIKSGDPATLKKLMDSQRQCANQMLNKLMNGNGALLQVNPVSNGASKMGVRKSMAKKKSDLRHILPAATSTPTAVVKPPTKTTTAPVNVPTTLPTILNTAAMRNALGVLAKIPTTTTAKLPMRPVTIKKLITSTAVNTTTLTPPAPASVKTTTTTSSQSVPGLYHLNPAIKVRPFQSTSSTMTTTTTTTTTSTTVADAKGKRSSAPLIKTVPLSQLQEPAPKTTAVVKPTDVLTVPIVTSTTSSVDDANLEKLQKDLEELRRTVAILQKSQKTLTTDNDEPQSKKPKI